MSGGVVAVDVGRLTGLVDELTAIDTSTWTDGAVADSFVGLRREIDRLEAVAAGLLRSVADRLVSFEQGATSTPAWAQWQAGQRWREAKASLAAATACERLPLTHKAWLQGEISASAARTICRGIKPGHEDVYVELEETLVEWAAKKGFRELDGLIGYYRKCCDAIDDIEPVDRNGLHLSRVGDRWALSGDFDAAGGEYVDKAVTAALDTPTEGDERTPSRLRADAMVRICRFFLDHEELPIEAGEAPHVSLTLSWESLHDWLPITALPSDPSDLGAILSSTERDRILCDCNVARIILGPDSQPLDVGREHRTAPRWLRRAVAQRDRGCRYPGCDRRPNRCECHHVIPWEGGGPTSLANLVLLCPFHHHVVHRKGWTNHYDGLQFTVHNQHGHRIE